MTATEIHEAIKPHKPVSRTQLYNYFKALKIEPIGARQRPQRFPEDSALRILVHLGFDPENGKSKITVLPGSKRVVSLQSLKTVKQKRGAR
jgi:hypothetical protein